MTSGRITLSGDGGQINAPRDLSRPSKLIDMFCAKGLRFCLMVKKNECFHIGCGVNKKPPIDDAAALLLSVSLVF
ncbi:hypothetical protein J3L11_10345 [Shewanella sp. 4t3-1-2LB]|uniref:hypothetical protein n=1 Tax=Shewanella sp. 4t3-1-2LB TaxID=2817682 RepID=UPI001A99921D|nr:hypothetical protein [Shewanella sp. 4t3-1-2LB]MBO1272040.1 hypothetical protein [Shewanella sp. 4t3-1-2LB]